MHRETIFKTKDLLFNEMGKITSKGDISGADLDSLVKASKVLTNLETYEAMVECNEGASYEMGRMIRDNRYPEMSGRRGRGADGRFVSRGNHHEDIYDDEFSYNRGMSDSRRRGYDDGYSGHSVEDRAIMALEHQMDTAASEYDKNFLRQQIKAIREQQMK